MKGWVWPENWFEPILYPSQSAGQFTKSHLLRLSNLKQ